MVYIIAEAGVDHEGSLDRCLQLLAIARQGGANAFKLQYFRKGLRGPNRELPWLEPHEMAFMQEECIRSKLDFICTPHDRWALEKLETLALCDVYKIGSGDWHLIAPILKTGKSVIISTGMKSEYEVNKILDRGYFPHNQLRGLLHCVSVYPCPIEDANLGYMGNLIDIYGKTLVIGYSDHCEGYTACIAAVAMGAKIIEKHITLEHKVPGRQDTFCSLSGMEFEVLVKEIREVESAIINRGKKITDEERKTLEWVEARQIRR